MKKYFLLILILPLLQISNGQGFAIALDKMNVLYLGLDNPVTIAVENTSNKSLIVKTTNGKISGANGNYIFRGNEVGTAEISIYKKANNKLVKIGSSYFRVKMIPPPVFKIGSGRRLVPKAELVAQQYARADYDEDIRSKVDSFEVCIVSGDTCKVNKKNIGNEISEAIRNEFQQLKANDVVIFKNIFATGPDGTRELEPVMITIKE